MTVTPNPAAPAATGRSAGQRPAAPHHVDSLDGVRALAALAVVATHAGFLSGRSLDNGPFAPLLARLDFGVTLFFLLSGFLLFRPFAASILARAPLPGARTFWWRRAVRILPAYWLATAVVLGVLSLRTPSGADWAAYLTLTQTYTGHNVDSSLSQMWTLATEIAFYAFLPLLATLCRWLASRIDPLTALLSLLAAMGAVTVASDVVIHVAVGPATPSLLWLPANLDWFALGMLIGVVSVAEPGRFALGDRLRLWATDAPGTCLLFGGLVFWLATLPVSGPYDLTPSSGWQWTMRHGLYGLAAFFLLLPVMLGDNATIRRVLGNPVMRWLGTVSYGVYLWHLALLIALQHWLGWAVFSGHFAVLWLLASSGAIIAAAASWYLLERPLLRRLSRGRGSRE